MAFIRRLNTFGKVILLVCLLLIPVILLYAYFYQVSSNVVRENIEKENRNRLTFFMSQMESAVEQLTRFSVIVSRYSGMEHYLAKYEAMQPLERLRLRTDILEMLNLQILSSGWNNQIALYLREHKEVISTDYSIQYDEDYLLTKPQGQWMHQNLLLNGTDHSYFAVIRNSDTPEVKIEVRFTVDNIRNMLKQLKLDEDSAPFLYERGSDPIMNFAGKPEVVRRLIDYLDNRDLQPSGHETVLVGNQKYVVNYTRSESLGWYLVDYVPLENVLHPIRKSKNLFYSSIALLLVLSVLATLLLYRNVQRPIQLLLQGVKRIKKGQYSIRLKKQPNNEFDYLFISFNEMADQIQELIEKVYAEKMRAQEASLKQLQSQINPHFLYNCLFYMKNMASLGEKESVVAMALNLGEYYRASIRQESSMTTLGQEMQLVNNYLTIQNLRIQRFEYEVSIPDAMMELSIPRLLVQPIVENAVIHGIEKNPEFGLIAIWGEHRNGLYRIIIEDNGLGLTQEQLHKLRRNLKLPMDEEIGCGVWNVEQRLVLLYKGRSGLQISQSQLGGLRVELVWEDGISS